MDHVVIYICISVMFMLVLMLMSVIHSKLHWTLKAALIAISLVVIAMDYRALTDSLGWPVTDRLPNKFRFISAVIDEPAAGRDGAIYVWYVSQGSPKPRSVVIDYDKDMHRKMAKAMSMASQGMDVYMGRSGDVQDAQGQGGRRPGNAKKGTGSEGQSEQQSEGPIDFIAPDSYLPRKD